MENLTGAESLRPSVARQRLVGALQRIGVCFSDAIQIVEYDPDAETAYWKYEYATGRDFIGVGPRILALDSECVEMVLRHEILHRSMFHGFGERFRNRLLSNLTQDICINRLLFEAFPEGMKKLSGAIYEDEDRDSAIALADCTASPFRLPEEMGRIWKEVWLGGSGMGLNPSSLYYRLIKLGLSDDPRLARYAGWGEGETAWPSRVMERAAEAVLDELDRHLPRSSRLRSSFSEHIVVPSRIETAPVDRFVRNLAVRRVLDEVDGLVTGSSRNRTRVQPFPAYPSRKGLVHEALGLTRVFHLYHNRETEDLKARLALGLYVDVSGSMISHFPVISTLVGALRGFPLRIRAFDTSLKEVAVDSFSSGRIGGGGGTDFDLPLTDLVGDDEVGAGLIVTDGYAEVSAGVGRRFQASGKDLFVIYLRDSSAKTVRGDSLSRYAREVLEVDPRTLGSS